MLLVAGCSTMNTPSADRRDTFAAKLEAYPRSCAKCLYVTDYHQLLAWVAEGDQRIINGMVRLLPDLIRDRPWQSMVPVSRTDAYNVVMALTIYYKAGSLEFLDKLPVKDQEVMLIFYADLDRKGQITKGFSEALERYLDKHSDIDKGKIIGQPPPAGDVLKAAPKE